MKIAIVVVADEAYLPAACCVVISCRRAGRVTEPIFLIATDVSENSIEMARRFLMERGTDAEIISFRLDPSDYRVDAWVSPATYVRLHLDQVLDGSWDRVLYLDADTRVMVPLWPLLRANLNGCILGAVSQFIDRDDHEHLERLSMGADSCYFNSGILLFEWRAILSSGLLAESRRFAIENAHLCKVHDQDALNKIFEGLWMPLHVGWNYGHILAKRIPRERPFIKHYTFPHKPWGPKKRPFWIADAFWYWRTLRKSSWPDFVHPITFRDLRDRLGWLFRVWFSEPPSYRLSNDGLGLEPSLPAWQRRSRHLFGAKRQNEEVQLTHEKPEESYDRRLERRGARKARGSRIH